MKILKLIAVFSLISLASQAQSLTPGIWKTKTSFKLSGISLPSKEEVSCITEDEAKDAKTTITDGLKKQGCELNKWEVKNNKLQAALSCKNKDLEATGQIHGQFSKKSYSLDGEAEGTYKSAIPASATIRLTGQWVKKCGT